MKRVWWVTALLVIAIGLVAYNWRGDIAGFFGHADAQVAQAPSATPGANGRSGAQGRAAGQAGPATAGQTGSGAAGRGNAAAGRTAAGGAARGGPGGAGALPPFEVATAVATAGALPDQRSTIGWILSANTTNLTTQTAGIVQEIDAVAGTDVKTSDVLVKLDARTANAAITKDKATLQRDQATLTEAQHTADTDTSLAQKGAGTEDAAQQAETAAAVATATVAVDNAQLAADQVTLDNTVIKAPFDGRIGAFQVSRRQPRSAGRPGGHPHPDGAGRCAVLRVGERPCAIAQRHRAAARPRSPPRPPAPSRERPAPSPSSTARSIAPPAPSRPRHAAQRRPRAVAGPVGQHLSRPRLAERTGAGADGRGRPVDHRLGGVRRETGRDHRHPQRHRRGDRRAT